MKNNKLQVGDPILISGPSHYEKAIIVKIDKSSGIITLDNQMRIDREYNNLSKTSMRAEPFDQDKFDFLHANSLFDSNIRTLLSQKSQLPEEAVIAINSRLEKWIQKYNLKRI